MNKNKHYGLSDSLIEAAKACMSKEELVGGQKKIDVNKNGKLDAEDFKKLRSMKKEQAPVNEADIKEGTGTLKPGWMLKKDPKLATIMKAKIDLAKKRQATYGDPASGKSLKEEEAQIDEAFPTVADAMKKDKEKSTFDKKKISTGTVYTKKYKEKEKEEKDEKGEMDEAMDAPFDGPYAKKKIAVPGKQGIGPSTAKHLAKMAMAKQIKKLNK